MTAAGAATVNPYVEVGPTFQTMQVMVGELIYGTILRGAQNELPVHVILDPGNWSLDNFGQVLVATIFNGKTFTWNAGASGARGIRASQSTSGFA